MPPVLREINRGGWIVRRSQGLFPFFENLRRQGENSVGTVPANNETGGNSERAIYGGISLLCENRKLLRLGTRGHGRISFTRSAIWKVRRRCTAQFCLIRSASPVCIRHPVWEPTGAAETNGASGEGKMFSQMQIKKWNRRGGSCMRDVGNPDPLLRDQHRRKILFSGGR